MQGEDVAFVGIHRILCCAIILRDGIRESYYRRPATVTTTVPRKTRQAGQKNISWKILAAYLDAAQLPLRTLFGRLNDVDVLLWPPRSPSACS